MSTTEKTIIDAMLEKMVKPGLIIINDTWDGDTEHDVLKNVVTNTGVFLELNYVTWKDVTKGILLLSDGYRGEQFYFGVLYLGDVDQWILVDLMEGTIELCDIDEQEYQKLIDNHAQKVN